MRLKSEGLVLIDKPAGLTSFSVLRPVKEIFGTKRIGHTGTLDKFAEGLLVVLIGNMTRFAPFFTEFGKEYRTRIEFGKETDTLDPEGEIIRTGRIPSFDEVKRALSGFRGVISQVPPVYSAVHTGGERAYRLARLGREVKLEPRQVEIHAVEVEGYDPPFLRLRISCSKGTYIRSLARDLGYGCGTCAYVKELERTKVGPFSIDEAIKPSDLTCNDMVTPDMSISRIPGIGRVTVSGTDESGFGQGRLLDGFAYVPGPPDEGLSAVFSRTGRLLGLIERRDGALSYRFVSANPDD